jgi:hypothetical protein
MLRIRIILNAEPDPTFYFDADLDPAAHQSEENPKPLVYKLSRALFLVSTPPLSLHGHPRLHFEPLKLLNFDLNADPSNAYGIRIRNPNSLGYFTSGTKQF